MTQALAGDRRADTAGAASRGGVARPVRAEMLPAGRGGAGRGSPVLLPRNAASGRARLLLPARPPRPPPPASGVPSFPLPSRRPRCWGLGGAAHGGVRGAPPGPDLPPRLRAGRLRDRPAPPGDLRRQHRRPGGPLLLRHRGGGGGAPRRSVRPAGPRRARGLHRRGRQHGAAVRRGGRPRAAGAVPAAQGGLGAEQEPLRMEPPHAGGQVREGPGRGARAAVPPRRGAPV